MRVTPTDAALMAGTRRHKVLIESHMQFVSLWLYGFPDVNNLSSCKVSCDAVNIALIEVTAP